jgi:purine-binding chemotaxis protein CheW
MEKQLVIFELGNEYFGVDIAAVESIIKMQEITRVPQAPDFVEGITNLRGAVLPVIELRKRLGLPDHDRDKETRIIVVNLDDMEVGMVVDAVWEVITISDDIIEPTPPMVTTVDTGFITGIARLEERLVILLDLTSVLTVEEQKLLTDSK